MLAAVEVGQGVFQAHVAVVAAVGDARAGGPGALATRGLHRLLYAVRVEREAKIIIRAQEYRFSAVQHALGGGEHAFKAHAEGIDAVLAQGVIGMPVGGMFREYCHPGVPLRRSSTAWIKSPTV